MLDRHDLGILDILQRAARTPNVAIARKVGLAPSATLERIRKLEKRAVVRSYTARLDPKALGVGLLAFVFVRSDERAGETRTARALASRPEVLEVHHIAGEDCFLVKVRAADTEALGRMLREVFGAVPTVRSTRTTIVLETVKETSGLPLPAGPGGRRRRGGGGGARG
jgi:Lrp/AsnC family leucine-responsive transcriptional regulator